MNSLKENIAMGLLVALAIGPSLAGDASLSLAVRLCSAALIGVGMAARWISESTSPTRGKEARPS
jgi:hypothetical protein